MLYIYLKIYFHERTKHIDIKLHFIRYIISKKAVLLEKISTQYNLSVMITKVLNKFKSYLQILKVDTS